MNINLDLLIQYIRIIQIFKINNINKLIINFNKIKIKINMIILVINFKIKILNKKIIKLMTLSLKNVKFEKYPYVKYNYCFNLLIK